METLERRHQTRLTWTWVAGRGVDRAAPRGVPCVADDSGAVWAVANGPAYLFEAGRWVRLAVRFEDRHGRPVWIDLRLPAEAGHGTLSHGEAVRVDTVADDRFGVRARLRPAVGRLDPDAIINEALLACPMLEPLQGRLVWDLLPRGGEAGGLAREQVLADVACLLGDGEPRARWAAMGRLRGMTAAGLLPMIGSFRERWPPSVAQHGRAPWCALLWLVGAKAWAPAVDTVAVIRRGWTDADTDATGALRAHVWVTGEDADRAMAGLGSAEAVRRHPPKDPPGLVAGLGDLARALEPHGGDLVRAAVTIARRTLLRKPDSRWTGEGLAGLPPEILEVVQLWLSAARSDPSLGQAVADALDRRGVRAEAELLPALRGERCAAGICDRAIEAARAGDLARTRRLAAIAFAAAPDALSRLAVQPEDPVLGSSHFAGDWLYATGHAEPGLAAPMVMNLVGSGAWRTWAPYQQNQLWLTALGCGWREPDLATVFSGLAEAALDALAGTPITDSDQRRITLLALLSLAPVSGSLDAHLAAALDELLPAHADDGLAQRALLTVVNRPVEDARRWADSDGATWLRRSLGSGSAYLVSAALAVRAHAAGLQGLAAWIANPASHMGFFRRDGARWAAIHMEKIVTDPRGAFVDLLRHMLGQTGPGRAPDGIADAAFRFLAIYEPERAGGAALDRAETDPVTAVRWLDDLRGGAGPGALVLSLLPRALGAPPSWARLAECLQDVLWSATEEEAVGAEVAAAVAAQRDVGPLTQLAVRRGWLQRGESGAWWRESTVGRPKERWGVQLAEVDARWAGAVAGNDDWVEASVARVATLGFADALLEEAGVDVLASALRGAPRLAPGAERWAVCLLERDPHPGLETIRRVAGDRKVDPLRRFARRVWQGDDGGWEDVLLPTAPSSEVAHRLAGRGASETWRWISLRRIAATRRWLERIAHDFQKVDLDRVGGPELGWAFASALRTVSAPSVDAFVDPAALVESAVNQVVREQGLGGVAVVRRFSPPRPSRDVGPRKALRYNPALLDRVLVNLVGNAIKHGTGHRAEVTVDADEVRIANGVCEGSVDWPAFGCWLSRPAEYKTPPYGLRAGLGSLAVREALARMPGFGLGAHHDPAAGRLTVTLRWGAA